MVTIRVETNINATTKVVFDLARSLSVHTATTKGSNEIIVSQHENDLLSPGEIVTFEATHFGVRQRLTSEFVEFDPPHKFKDKMLNGAFRTLEHEHHFESTASGGTIMTDILSFESPLGPLGRLFDFLFLANYMTRFIQSRGQSLKQIAEQTEHKAE